MAYQPKKKQPERPDDNLPPAQLEKAWEEYLDYHVGKQGKRPKKEVLISPLLIEWFAETVVGSQRLTPLEETPKKLLYLEVLRESLEEIPLLNRDIVRRYFGIEWDSPQTQDHIAKDIGLSQKNVSLRLKYAKRDLSKIMRQKLKERIMEELQKDES